VPGDLRGLRVFIATPGGLDPERRAFRQVLTEFNEDDAYERGVVFIPTGWELTLAGVGRPQEIINEEVRRCDYLVLLLWDRWGTPPATSGPYTSGTEEEYAVARECLADDKCPMRDIVVLFKGVDARQLSDPGDQLRKVLGFKRTLEEQKTIYFATFDSPDEFKRDLQRHLMRWMRDEGEGATLTAPPAPSETPGEKLFEPPERPEGEDASQLLDMASRLADEGRLAEAESLFASAVVARTDVTAMTKYTRFLRRTGRQDLAHVMAARLLEVGRQTDDKKAQIEALSNIAILRRQEGNLNASLELLHEAIALADAMGEPGLSELAFLHDNVGLTMRRQGRIREAIEEYKAALDIRSGLDDPKGLASTLNNVGVLARQTGDIATAEEHHRSALEFFRQINYLRGEAITQGYLGEVFEAAGRLDEAEAAYLAALDLDERLKSHQGTSMNLCQLGRLALHRGNVDVAADYARRALDAGESFGNREGIAAAYHLFGQIGLARGDFELALGELETAVELYRDLEHRVGIGWALADLALAQCRSRLFSAARQTLEEARTASEGLNHQALTSHIATIASELASATQEDGRADGESPPDGSSPTG
jgi:tetratricopeptide (TPR) repeat protein